MIRLYGEEYVGSFPGDESLSLTRYHSCELSQSYEALEWWKSVLWLSLRLKGIKGKISFFFSVLLYTYTFEWPSG